MFCEGNVSKQLKITLTDYMTRTISLVLLPDHCSCVWIETKTIIIIVLYIASNDYFDQI